MKGDVLKIEMVIGDANDNGMTDVRVKGYVDMPFDGSDKLVPIPFEVGPVDVPVEQAAKIGGALLSKAAALGIGLIV